MFGELWLAARRLETTCGYQQLIMRTQRPEKKYLNEFSPLWKFHFHFWQLKTKKYFLTLVKYLKNLTEIDLFKSSCEAFPTEGYNYCSVKLNTNTGCWKIYPLFPPPFVMKASELLRNANVTNCQRPLNLLSRRDL